jgi:predicted DCC family thiol-disulfide oxidoreductase YuxK
MNNMKEKQNLKVYYDGLCRLCSREIEHYKSQVGSDKIDFVDICTPGFDANQEGLDPFAIHKVMHVRRLDGTLAIRVQAFIEIWKVLPRYRKLALIASVPAINKSLEISYSIFARIRPLLPRKKADLDCSDSPYCEMKNV